jgi:diketogulonate reductase-like aldo/keto reductase
MENKDIKLSSGHSMPRFGLGTWGSTDCEVLVKAAVEQGYRLFDCASRYGNEEMVGEALKKV